MVTWARPVAAQLNEDRPDFNQQLSMALVRNAKQLCSVIFVVGRTPKEAMSIPANGIPKDAYYMSGAEGNTTLIMPSHGVVIAKHAWSPASVKAVVA